MLAKPALFLFVAVTSYLALAGIFWLTCTIGGHNSMESLYGGWAKLVLPLAAATVAVYISSQQD